MFGGERVLNGLLDHDFGPDRRLDVQGGALGRERRGLKPSQER